MGKVAIFVTDQFYRFNETKTTATASNIVPEVPVQPGITPVNKTQEISNINQNVNSVNTGVNNVNNNSNLEIVEI